MMKSMTVMAAIQNNLVIDVHIADVRIPDSFIFVEK
jgi:hypothetical protein